MTNATPNLDFVAPRVDDGSLVRYGIQHFSPTEPICRPMLDGYWTPWHEAEAALRTATQEREDLKQVCVSSNAACSCGCPPSEHENLGEDGEQCERDDHQCVPTSVAVAGMLNDLRAALRTVREELRAVEDACGDVGVNLVISLPNAVRNLKSELQAVREERDDLKKWPIQSQ